MHDRHGQRRSLFTDTSKLSFSDFVFHRFHAVLGVYVAFHLVYRYYCFFVANDDDDDMGFDVQAHDDTSFYSNTTLFFKWFLPHLLLQISGLTFTIPSKRHPDGNRIWPQYRYEALVFCLRCLTLAFIAWRRKLHGWKLEEENDDGSYCSIVPAAIVVFVTMIGADHVSRWYQVHMGVEGSPTIRGLSAPKWAQYFMSSAQFHATIHCLLTSDRLSVQIAALTVVQFSAFGMTLRRKGFISQRQGVVLYSFILVLGLFVIIDDLKRRSLLNVAMFLGNIAAIVRMNGGLNKYVLWTVVIVVILRFDTLGKNSFIDNALMNTLGWLGLLIGCTCKHHEGKLKKI